MEYNWLELGNKLYAGFAIIRYILLGKIFILHVVKQRFLPT